MKPIIYRWPASSTTAIAALQTLASAGNLSINGSMAVIPNDGGPASVNFTAYSRVITITSANNLSGVNFTVTGTFNGAVVSQTIAGPNAGTVSTTQLFDSVSSVSASAAAAAVSVGTGATGNTTWFNSDYCLNIANMAIQVVVTGTITYSFETTLDDVNTVPSPTVFTPIAAMTAATSTQLASYTVPARFSNISVTAGTGSLVATMVQQGISVV